MLKKKKKKPDPPAARFHHSQCSKGHVLVFWFFHSFNTCLLGPCLSVKYGGKLCRYRSEEERAKPCPQGTYTLIKQRIPQVIN